MNNIYVEGQLASMRLQDHIVRGEEERQAKEFATHQYRGVKKRFSFKSLQLSLQRLGIF